MDEDEEQLLLVVALIIWPVLLVLFVQGTGGTAACSSWNPTNDDNVDEGGTPAADEAGVVLNVVLVLDEGRENSGSCIPIGNPEEGGNSRVLSAEDEERKFGGAPTGAWPPPNRDTCEDEEPPPVTSGGGRDIDTEQE